MALHEISDHSAGEQDVKLAVEGIRSIVYSTDATRHLDRGQCDQVRAIAEVAYEIESEMAQARVHPQSAGRMLRPVISALRAMGLE